MSITYLYQPSAVLPQLPLVSKEQAIDLEENYGCVEGIHFWVTPSAQPLLEIDSWKPEGFTSNAAFVPPGQAFTSPKSKSKSKSRNKIAYYRETIARRLYEAVSGSDFPDESIEFY